MDKSQDSISLVYCISRRYLGLLTCSLKSISIHGGYSHYDIYIYLSYADTTMEHILSRSYGPHMTFHVIQPTDPVWDIIPQNIQSHGVRIYRFLVPYLLPNKLEKVLYLDADTIVINSLKELYETPFEDNWVIACTNGQELLEKINDVRKQAEKPALRTNPGVLLIDLCAYRREIPLSKTLDRLSSKKPCSISLERFALMLLCGARIKLTDALRFNLSDKVLNLYNSTHRRAPVTEYWIAMNTSIIHFSGQPKPGKPEYTGKLEPFYKNLFQYRTTPSSLSKQ